jgi:thiol:disulfide interchange protein DsbD
MNPYQLSAQVTAFDRVALNWTIAEGTYLYRDKIRVQLDQGDGVTLGEIALPKPVIKKNVLRPDGTTGDTAVYYHQLNLGVPLIRSSENAMEIQLRVHYQGCADEGICYPPVKKLLTLSLPAAGTEVASTATPPAEAQSAPPQSEQDQIAALLAEGNLWISMAAFFGFGILLSLTPCVFPLVPILSGLIVGQGEELSPSRGFLLSLIYVVAMASAYAIAGVVAGLLGYNLQAELQNPWLLSAFALLFVLLALSMFGFYELQLPSSWQGKLRDLSNRQQGGTWLGVAVMGFLSALIVGPCVAPPMAGAFLYIAKSGDGLLGGLAFFALGIGMGAPLLIIGASAGKLLPRAGAWMNRVQGVFGVFFLAVAILLLERILPVAVALLLWGTLLIVSSIYLGALRRLPPESTGWSRLWKGVGVVLLIYGALMLLGAAAGGKDTLQPLRGVQLFSTASERTEHKLFKPIKTSADLQRELMLAKAQGKPLMLDFYADWCTSCVELERYTFSDSTVQSALQGFVLLQADVTAWDEEDQNLLVKQFGLSGPPAIIFYDREGKEQRALRLAGFIDAEAFIEHIQWLRQ